jgi:hypothetical protein
MDRGSEFECELNSRAGYFAHKSLFEKSERWACILCVYLIDLYLIGLRLVNLRLIGLHFIGLHLIGRHLKRGSRRHAPHGRAYLYQGSCVRSYPAREFA